MTNAEGRIIIYTFKFLDGKFRMIRVIIDNIRFLVSNPNDTQIIIGSAYPGTTSIITHKESIPIDIKVIPKDNDNLQVVFYFDGLDKEYVTEYRLGSETKINDKYERPLIFLNGKVGGKLIYSKDDITNNHSDNLTSNE